MNQSKFTRGAWLTLAFVLFLFAWGTGGVLYYFTLPTDGWFTKAPDTFGTPGYIYVENLMALPSGLQIGDHLIAVEGLPAGDKGNPYGDKDGFSQLQDRWRAGNTFRYTVERQQKEREKRLTAIKAGA